MKRFILSFFYLFAAIPLSVAATYSDREIKETIKQAIILNSKLDQLFTAKYGKFHPFKPYIEKTKRILAAYIKEYAKQEDRDIAAFNNLEEVISGISQHAQNIVFPFSEQQTKPEETPNAPLPQQPMQDYLHTIQHAQGAVPQSYQQFIAGQKEQDAKDFKNALSVFGVTFGSALLLGAGFLWWRHFNAGKARSIQERYNELIRRATAVAGRFNNIATQPRS